MQTSKMSGNRPSESEYEGELGIPFMAGSSMNAVPPNMDPELNKTDRCPKGVKPAEDDECGVNMELHEEMLTGTSRSPTVVSLMSGAQGLHKSATSDIFIPSQVLDSPFPDSGTYNSCQVSEDLSGSISETLERLPLDSVNDANSLASEAIESHHLASANDNALVFAKNNHFPGNPVSEVDHENGRSLRPPQPFLQIDCDIRISNSIPPLAGMTDALVRRQPSVAEHLVNLSQTSSTQGAHESATPDIFIPSQVLESSQVLEDLSGSLSAEAILDALENSARYIDSLVSSGTKVRCFTSYIPVVYSSSSKNLESPFSDLAVCNDSLESEARDPSGLLSSEADLHSSSHYDVSVPSKTNVDALADSGIYSDSLASGALQYLLLDSVDDANSLASEAIESHQLASANGNALVLAENNRSVTEVDHENGQNHRPPPTTTTTTFSPPAQPSPPPPPPPSLDIEIHISDSIEPLDGTTGALVRSQPLVTEHLANRVDGLLVDRNAVDLQIKCPLIWLIATSISQDQYRSVDLPSLVRSLLGSGASVNERDNNGHTALWTVVDQVLRKMRYDVILDVQLSSVVKDIIKALLEAGSVTDGWRKSGPMHLIMKWFKMFFAPYPMSDIQLAVLNATGCEDSFKLVAVMFELLLAYSVKHDMVSYQGNEINSIISFASLLVTTNNDLRSRGTLIPFESMMESLCEVARSLVFTCFNVTVCESLANKLNKFVVCNSPQCNRLLKLVFELLNNRQLLELKRMMNDNYDKTLENLRNCLLGLDFELLDDRQLLELKRMMKDIFDETLHYLRENISQPRSLKQLSRPVVLGITLNALREAPNLRQPQNIQEYKTFLWRCFLLLKESFNL